MSYSRQNKKCSFKITFSRNYTTDLNHFLKIKVYKILKKSVIDDFGTIFSLLFILLTFE